MNKKCTINSGLITLGLIMFIIGIVSMLRTTTTPINFTVDSLLSVAIGLYVVVHQVVNEFKRTRINMLQ